MLRASDGKLDLGAEVYWCKTPVASGFVYEMSGWASLSEIIRSERILRQLLRVPDGAELVSYSDPKMSNFRYAGLIDGRLEACVFFGAPGAAFPEADRAAELLGKSVPPVARLSLLAGCDAGAPRGGATVCACFGVGEAAIRDAIHAGNSPAPPKLARSAPAPIAARASRNSSGCWRIARACTRRRDMTGPLTRPYDPGSGKPGTRPVRRHAGSRRRRRLALPAPADSRSRSAARRVRLCQQGDALPSPLPGGERSDRAPARSG